jgi:hypothetical protein
LKKQTRAPGRDVTWDEVAQWCTGPWSQKVCDLRVVRIYKCETSTLQVAGASIFDFWVTDAGLTVRWLKMSSTENWSWPALRQELLRLWKLQDKDDALFGDDFPDLF